MPIYQLDDNYPWFPNPAEAESNGILAIGGDLSATRLLIAYRYGIFPWYSEGEPIIWWSPNPRFVLFPDELKVSRSMRPYFNQKKFACTFDQDFETVMRACQTTNRPGQSGTWITEDMIDAYVHLHELGYAHSVEVWKGDDLVGGLYGIALGKVFFGESMFARTSNASKFGFIRLVGYLQEREFQLIDCQQQTTHLASLGARAISRKEFLDLLSQHISDVKPEGKWPL